MLKKQSQRQIAFTLIELLIVVAIIAILAAIAVPNFLEAQVRSKVSRAVSDMRSVGIALESYRVDNNQYTRANSLYPNLSVNDYPWMYCGYLKAEDAVNKNPDGNYRIYSVRELTTPIAYLSDLPWDAFANTKQDVNYRRYSYGYTNFAGLSTATDYPKGPAYGSSPELRLVAGSTSGKRSSWLLSSGGPDGVTNFAYLAVLPTGMQMIVENTGAYANQAYSIMTTYDPSNGTVSVGDIFRTQ